MSGYTLSHRDKWSNPVFRNLLEAGIWSWICDTAAWKDTRVRFAGKLIALKRGQIVVSERFISEGFCVGRQIVRTFLDNLENDHMITREVTQSTTIITICNYSKYQVEENHTNPLTNPEPTHSPTQSQPTPNPNKNEGNKGNKGNKEDISLYSAGAVAKKPTLKTINFEHIQPWINQQAVSGNIITADVRAELERFRTHFLSYDGKDKNGNAISDWVAKFGSWILNEQKQQKYGARNEITRPNRINQGNPRSLPENKAERLDDAFAEIIRSRNQQQFSDITPNSGMHQLPE